MPAFKNRLPLTSICALMAATGVVAAGAPALAQTVEELTVTGRLGDANELSRVVSYADLDLTTSDGEEMLKTRVKETASDLCRLLGESDAPSTPLVPSCEKEAVNGAMSQVKQAIAMATPRTAVAVAPAPAYATEASAEAPAAPMMDAAPPAPVYVVKTVTNGPIPDTPEAREMFGGPNSNAGRRTEPAGN